ncbi:hypothetical protein PYCCODRAFT_1463632 [Trametes coccinea BRFM310]|uniref:Uncharacterized protein n=1 Tax=Trametes coccinea (strain BRFM310) TaxID=1353009 RepID=A0A1Y2J4J8_TRAC3|nr:hypothetical protein PYCCODRAFT_1463632 [Trametes coccinea BRFM310]
MLGKVDDYDVNTDDLEALKEDPVIEDGATHDHAVAICSASGPSAEETPRAGSDASSLEGEACGSTMGAAKSCCLTRGHEPPGEHETDDSSNLVTMPPSTVALLDKRRIVEQPRKCRQRHRPRQMEEKSSSAQSSRLSQLFRHCAPHIDRRIRRSRVPIRSYDVHSSSVLSHTKAYGRELAWSEAPSSASFTAIAITSRRNEQHPSGPVNT